MLFFNQADIDGTYSVTDELEERIEVLETTVVELDEDIDNINAYINILQADVNDIDADIEGMLHKVRGYSFRTFLCLTEFLLYSQFKSKRYWSTNCIFNQLNYSDVELRIEAEEDRSEIFSVQITSLQLSLDILCQTLTDVEDQQNSEY